MVAAALHATGGAWRLVRALPSWPTRGLAEAPGGELCVRASAADATHGFFVARFERGADGPSTLEQQPTKKRKKRPGKPEAG